MTTENCEIILPVTFEAQIQITMQERLFTVQLQAPGTIAANYYKCTTLMTFFEFQLDTQLLARDMMKQARLVVFEAVARVTNSPNLLPKDVPINHTQSTTTTTNNTYSTSTATQNHNSSDYQELSSFQSALNISPEATTASSRLQVINHSAVEHNHHHSLPSHTNMHVQNMQLRESASQKFLSVMTSKIPQSPSLTQKSSTTNIGTGTCINKSSLLNGGKSNNQMGISASTAKNISRLDKGSKQRSVQWDLPDDLSRSKRRKLNIDRPLKRSKISFGKPDADTFSSVRNATFGEFGQITRTGIIAAENKTPSHSLAYRQYEQGQFSTLNGNRNHTFATLHQHNVVDNNVGTNASFSGVRTKPYVQPIGSMLLDTLTSRKNIQH